MSARRDAVAIVGAGGLARAMARALGRSEGVSVTVASRRPETAAALASGLRGVRASRRVEDAIAGAGIVLLAVPDRAIAPLARAIGPLRPSWRGVVVLHAAGAYGPELLAPLRRRGASTGVLHPLATLGEGRGAALAGAFARVEGLPAARTAARRLCVLAGLVPLRGTGLGTPSGRRRYHAAASLASNDVVALLAAAHALLVASRVPEREALAALTRLTKGAVDTARRRGLRVALTGPVARNDAGTLEAQLSTLARFDPAAAVAHRALSLRLIELARSAGRLSRAESSALRLRLERGPGRSGTV